MISHNFPQRLVDLVKMVRDGSNTEDMLYTKLLALVNDARKTRRAIERALELGLITRNGETLVACEKSDEEMDAIIRQHIEEKKAENA